jgi:hypothetical protein
MEPFGDHLVVGSRGLGSLLLERVHQNYSHDLAASAAC